MDERAKDKYEQMLWDSLADMEDVEYPRHYMGAYGVDAANALRNMMDRKPMCMRACTNAFNTIIPISGSTMFWWGACFKYLWRWPMKDGIKDLVKARECLERIICEVEDRLRETSNTMRAGDMSQPTTIEKLYGDIDGDVPRWNPSTHGGV